MIRDLRAWHACGAAQTVNRPLSCHVKLLQSSSSLSSLFKRLPNLGGQGCSSSVTAPPTATAGTEARRISRSTCGQSLGQAISPRGTAPGLVRPPSPTAGTRHQIGEERRGREWRGEAESGEERQSGVERQREKDGECTQNLLASNERHRR